MGRFDWDGVNLAELYFESLEGIGDPVPLHAHERRGARAVPAAAWVRSDRTVRSSARTRSPARCFSISAEIWRAAWRRSGLAKWRRLRRRHPQLDLVLTHVDDRFDLSIRDAIGSDAARLMPLLEKQNFTFLIEDPASLWNLGPRRYREISEQYRPLTARRKQAGHRHQHRGALSGRLSHQAADRYGTVPDCPSGRGQLRPRGVVFRKLAVASGLEAVAFGGGRGERGGELGKRTVVESASGVGLAWRGPAMVDGQPWPVFDEETVWLPAGRHTVEAGRQRRGLHLLRVNADLKAARAVNVSEVRFSYESGGRALAILDRAPVRVEVDGAPVQPPQLAGPTTVILPRGQHLVTI